MLRFTKMQAIGNDYIYINCFEETVKDPSRLAIQFSDRHFGIGSDGVILIRPSDNADFFMDIYNADGSRAKMCGNGIRSVGKYVYERGLTDRTVFTVETLGGIKTLRLETGQGKVRSVTVDMGAPELDPKKIPANFPGESAVNVPLTVDGTQYRVTCVSMGNPHCVLFVDNVKTAPVETLGPKLEHHPAFPERANIEFVQVMGPDELAMRVWERGSGETMACGTGSCASLVAAVLNGLCRREAAVHLLGGDLKDRWDEGENTVYMQGPAEFVFDGVLEGDF